jgi:heat-inducible transcriptional repressor
MQDKMNLSDREKLVLYDIIKNFILTANPVGSNFLANNSHLSFSPATIRNIMVELEAKGFIYHPHTSAGRIPTTVGYRIFVNQMMKKARLTTQEKEKIQEAITSISGDYETVFRESTRILALLSQQLSIIISPQLADGEYNRMDINRLGNNRLMLIISIKSGIVKTIILDIKSDIPDKQIHLLQKLLNERLHGLKLKEIRSKFKKIIEDLPEKDSPLMHLFIETADRIFNFSEDNSIFFTGTHNMLRQPEFTNHKELSSVVEILEDKNIIIHLLDQRDFLDDVNIYIGEEIEEEKMKNCSIIAARYKIGEVQGTIGIVGPTRMDYSHLIPLVEFTAFTLSDSI